MTTLAEALREAEAMGLARLDAQLLLLHALGRAQHDRAWLIAHDDDPLDEAQAAEFFDALQRMEDQAVTQRRDALTAKSREGTLDSAEKAELRELLAARVRPPVASA